ncbi:hypothetical protein [Streptomyces cucumeris]|uniref:hypothetical protein n=1 Tax=Streptomyces cucumeris TaxID=2962890 RepID=UPI003EBF72B0
MRDDAMPPKEALTVSFGQDLMTEWIPDALGATDVVRGLADGSHLNPTRLDVGWLQVPLAHRTETIPVVPQAVRAHMHRLVERSLHRYRPRPEVFSYRSTEWEYRGAYRARQRRMRELGSREDLPLVLRLDVRQFGASLPLRVLLDAPWMTEDLAQQVTTLHGASGRCLLPGHRWANRLGTAALAPIDNLLAAEVPERWLRWGDDWHVFVRGAGEAERIREVVASGLANLGLSLSVEKTVWEPVHRLFAGAARDVAGDPRKVWRAGIRDGDMRALRYALTRAEPTTEIFRDISEVVRMRAELLPRAIQYLDRAMTTPGATEVVEELFDDSDLFTAARVLTLAGRHQELARRVPDRLLILAADCGIAGLCALAARVAFSSRRGHLVGEPPPRMLPWISQGADLRQLRPSVATLL